MSITFDFWKNLLNEPYAINASNYPRITNPFSKEKDVSIFLADKANDGTDDLNSPTTDEFVPSTRNIHDFGNKDDKDKTTETDDITETDDNKEIKPEEKADKKYDTPPFFLSSDAQDVDFNALLTQEDELDKIISESTLLSKDTIKKRNENSEKITEVFDKLYSYQGKLDKLTDEEKEEVNKLYEELKTLLAERAEIEKQISEELQTHLNSEDEKKAEEAKQITDALKNIEETRGNFKVNSLSDAMSNAAEDTPTEENIDSQEIGNSPNINGGGGGGGGGVTGNGLDQVENNPSGLENMTVEQLKAEQEKKQTALDNAHNQVNDVYSGKNTAVAAAKENYATMKENYEKVVEELEKQGIISKELKQRQGDNLKNIEAKENEINNTKTEINNTDKAITDNRNSYTAAVSEKAALEAAIASYSNVNTEDNSKSEEIANKKAEAEKQLEAIKQKITTLENEHKTLTDKKTQLESTLNQQEKDLTTLETEKTQIEQEIQKSCEQLPAEQKEQVTNTLNEFNKARENVKTTEQEQLKIANKNIETAKTDLDKVNTVYNEKAKAETTGKYSYITTLMKNVVSFEGEDYLSVLSAKEIEQLKKYAAQHGYANIYEGWSDKCLQAAYEYELYAEGSQAKQLQQFTSPSRDEAIQKMAETLHSGHTVVAKVNTKKGTRHFVLVIGLKQNATAPYKESDFLCIDSYDHDVDKMGQPGQEAYANGNYRTLYQQNGEYWLASHVNI